MLLVVTVGAIVVIAVLALIDTYSNLVAIHLVKLKALEYAGVRCRVHSKVFRLLRGISDSLELNAHLEGTRYPYSRFEGLVCGLNPKPCLYPNAQTLIA